MNPATSTRQIETLVRRSYLCPSCSKLRLLEPKQASRKRPRTERYNSTLSTTAINGSRPIPERFRPLHKALGDVKTRASAHVNLSRLQLALQGLESERPVTRIALLGLDVQDTARRIARLLLADALEDEQAWERQILQHAGAQGILIRYGHQQNSNVPQRTALPVLQVPSPVLENLNVELLIASINAEGASNTRVPVLALLAPAMGVPTSFDGRQVTVNQPVHQSVVVAKGFDEFIQAIRLLSTTDFISQEDKNSVALVADLKGSDASSRDHVYTSNVARAEKGLGALRQSVSQATTYEHEWLASGLPRLSEWLKAASAQSSPEQAIPQPIANLIAAILTSTKSSLELNALSVAQKARTHGLDPAARLRIESAVQDFSRAAHLELQSGLASAWSSRNWRKLSWYKLFWRVDDVGLIISDLVTNTWLPRSERAVYEISGRLTQIGVDPVIESAEALPAQYETAFEPEPAKPTLLDPAPALLVTANPAPTNEVAAAPATAAVITTSPSTGRAGVGMFTSPALVPITTTISSSRRQYLNNQITYLTTTAQQIVFRTLSISGASAGLSALTYVSTIAPTVYEAGSIFAAGTVFALYRMQTGWQLATKQLEIGLFEEGRDVVRKVVQRMRDLLERKGLEVARGDPVEMKMLEGAQDAVNRAQKEFAQLQGTLPGVRQSR